jgi:autophagy-related protein 101
LHSHVPRLVRCQIPPCVDNAGLTKETDVLKVRRAMTKSLEKAAHKIISIVNRDKDHIPPITTTDANPFPYQIIVNPKSVSENDWRPRIGLF